MSNTKIYFNHNNIIKYYIRSNFISLNETQVALVLSVNVFLDFDWITSIMERTFSQLYVDVRIESINLAIFQVCFSNVFQTFKIVYFITIISNN